MTGGAGDPQTGAPPAYAFDDGQPAARDCEVLYALSLSTIRGQLGLLNGDDMAEPRVFNANAPWLLQQIAEFFEGVHATHETALAVHHAYRTEGAQYAVYLRNYVLGGLRTYFSTDDGWEGQDYFQSADWAYRKMVHEALDGRLDSLSFMNPHSPDVRIGQGPPVAIPSLRVLSHNWKGVVEEVVKGATLVVFVLDQASKGIEFELDLLRRHNMTERTILVVRHPDLARYADFEHVIESWDRDDPAVPALVRELAEDSFRQIRAVADLSAVPCHVVDRDLDLAAGQLAPEVLEQAAYEDLVPSSLASNWRVLAAEFPRTIEGWRAVEEQYWSGSPPPIDQVANVMYHALWTFIAAVTLERYYEMAVTIATVGIAHKTITGEWGLMIQCYEHGALFAQWSRDPAYGDYLRHAARDMREKYGGPPPS